MAARLASLNNRLRTRLDLAFGRVERDAEKLARKIKWVDWRPDRPSVLCLNRVIFSRDIEALRPRTNLNYATISAVAVKKRQTRWVDPAECVQTYFTARLDGDLGYLKRPLTRFGVALLKAASAQHPVDAVMAANTDYWQDEAVKLGCEALGIPFLVLCRENYAVELEQDLIVERVARSRFKFRGAGVALASEESRKALQATGGYAPGVLAVTGWPRFDVWRDVPHGQGERPFVTLMSYQAPTYLAPNNFVEVLHVFLKAASKSPAPENFILKVKKDGYLGDLYKVCPELQSSKVQVVTDWSMLELLGRSRMVVGYNTFGIMEAYLTDAAVVVPWWGDAVQPVEKVIVHAERAYDREVTLFPRSAAELEDLLSRAARDEPVGKGTRAERLARFSRESLFTDREMVSTAVERFVRQHLRSPAPGAAPGDPSR